MSKDSDKDAGGFGGFGGGFGAGGGFGGGFGGGDFGGGFGGFGAAAASSTKAASEDNEGEGAGDENPEAENQTQYEPVVKLSQVEVDSGEKDDELLYKQRCALYRFAPEVNPPIWKERGKGDVKFLKNKSTGLVRILLREEKTLKLRCNHNVPPAMELKPNPGSDRFWSWRTEDYSYEPPSTETFGIKFKTPEVANEFKKYWDESRKTNEAKKAAAGGEKKEESVWYSIIKDKKFAPLSNDDIKALWKHFDKDGNNSIEVSELKNLLNDLLNSVMKHLQVPLTDEVKAKVAGELPAMTEKALAKLDKNKDGKLSYEEFLNLNEVKMVQ